MEVVDFKYFVNAVFTAIFGVFGIYHFASYLILRHKILGYYFILVLGLTLHWSLYLFLYGSFGDEITKSILKVSLTTAMMVTFGLLAFTQSYLNISNRNYPRLARFYKIVIFIVVCLPVVHLFNAFTIGSGWLNETAVMLAAITALVSIFLNIFSGFHLYKAERFNKYYLFSYAPLLIAAILYVGTWFFKQYIEFDASYIVYITSILVTLQLILFSILVSFKFKNIEDENLKIHIETNKMLVKEVDRQTKNLQIAKKELVNQNKELQSVNKLKNKLFSLITHDLRAPLNHVTTIIELIEDDLANNQLKHIAKKLKHEIYDRVSMINALLEWSYQQLEGVTLNKKSCDLGLVFDSLKNEFERMAQDKAITIELNIMYPELYIDENMLKVILRNLISNAIKFSAKGKKIVMFSQRNSNTIEIGVKDFGLGMHTNWYTKLANEETFKISEGTQGEKGTGFGLLIAKDFVEMNGGEMVCESEMNKGTTFILRFEVEE